MDSAKIFIDTDNEITFILEKILASKLEKVCLVVPDRAAIFTSISGLKLIKRIVDKSNKLLVVVTLDENGASLTKRAGLSVVSRVGEINDELWEQIRKSKFDVIKKDKKKVFYVPETQIEKLDSVVEKKEEKISLPEVFQKTFENGDSNLVVDNINELSKEEIEERNVPQVSIKIDDKDLKKTDIEVLKTEEKDIEKTTVEKNLSEVFENLSPKRVRKRSTGSSLSFSEGSDLKNQKKNSLSFASKIPVITPVAIKSVKENIAAFGLGIYEKGKTISKKIGKKLKKVEFKRSLSPGPIAREIPLSQDKFTASPRRVAPRNIAESVGIRQNQSSVTLTQNKVEKGLKIPSIKLEGRKKIIFYASSLVIIPLFIILTGAYLFLNSMSLYTVNIRYKFLNVSDSRQIVASADDNSDFKIVKLSDTDSTSTSANASGQKIVGDKASGFISVFNATAEIKVLKKGTAVTCISSACNGLVYVTDSDLNLGPGSSANDLRIVAGDIGDDYNLPVNAGRFRIANFNANTEIIASNIQSLSGGTAKQTLKVISKEDIKAVEDKALADLRITLLNKIKNNPNNVDKYIFSENSFTVEKTASQTDAEGTQTEIINTNVTARGSIDAFPRDQIQPLVDEMKSKLAPSGYSLDEKFFNFTANPIPSEAGKIALRVQVNGVARIDIDLDKLENDLKGMSIREADNLISKLPNIEGFTSNYSPTSMPEWLRKVPSDSEKIQIKLVAESPD